MMLTALARIFAVAVALVATGAIAAAACGRPDTEIQEATIGPDTEIQEVTIGPERVECQGAAPMMCLVVDGLLFYQEIDGFEHEPGYEYRLRIEQYDAWPGQDEPPADASLYGYRLIEIIRKTPAAG